MLRRYELADENKFWEIWSEAQVVYFRFGKSGSQGQTKLKKVASPEAAVSEESRLVAEKEKQGYTLVSSNAAGKAKKAGTTKRFPSIYQDAKKSGLKVVIDQSGDLKPFDLSSKSK